MSMTKAYMVGALVVVAASAAQPPPSHAIRGSIPLTIQKIGPGVIVDRRLQSVPSLSAEYVGCFKDTGGDRVMEYKFVDKDMTNELCRLHCLEEDPLHMYYATQYGKECWCGKSNKFANYNKHGDGMCDKPCPGNAGDACGGEWAFTLFQFTDMDENTPSPQPGVMLPPVPGDMEELLQMHNAVRCMHGADPLAYSDTIAVTAKAYAQTLTNAQNCGELFHSEREDRNGWGENLFLCGSTDTTKDCYSAGYAMDGFYDKEVTDGPVTTYQGHATQILWKDTQEVGCAVESCEKIEQSRTWRYSVLVCNYNPTGNYLGQYEEQIETSSKTKEFCGYANDYEGGN